VLLTLILDGMPEVTSFWYPALLPGNAISVTSDGLVWTMDSLTVTTPGHGPGRCFIAREIQRRARTIDDVVSYLGAHPSAGGFGYIIGDRSGRVVCVDAAAGQHGLSEVGAAGPLAWHTNHPRYFTDDNFPVSGDSASRGQILAGAAVPRPEPETAWFLRLLSGAPGPDGVRVDPRGEFPVATICTFVASLTAGEAVILPRGGSPVAIGLANLAAGIASAAG